MANTSITGSSQHFAALVRQVAASGQSWAGPAAPRFVVRDPSNTIVFDGIVDLGPPVMATRMSASPDGFVLPDIRPAEATPTS